MRWLVVAEAAWSAAGIPVVAIWPAARPPVLVLPVAVMFGTAAVTGMYRTIAIRRSARHVKFWDFQWAIAVPPGLPLRWVAMGGRTGHRGRGGLGRRAGRSPRF